MTEQSSNVDYIPLLLQAAVAAGFVIFTLFVTHILMPRLNAKKKDENFECGIESQGNARFPVSIRYFMTAILFVLFDVEVIFFYPYAVNFYQLKLEGLLAVIMFVSFFLIGFLYVLKKGALEWEK
jgi:NADH-quinone oxidoreductase subunit A